MSRLHSRTVVALSVAILIAGSLAGPALADEPASPARDPQTEGETYYFADGVYTTPPGISFAPDRLLVKFRGTATSVQKSAASQAVNATVEKAFSLVPGLQVLKLREAGRANVVAAAAQLSRRLDVEYAMPDFAYQLAVEPNDPSYSSQWALPAIGAPEAWARSTGSNAVKVAIMDTGIDLDHPDLAANIVPGWDYVGDDSSPDDDNGHGTHVAGIIGAVGNNGIGVSGVNWSVSLMPLKICDQNGACYLSDEVEALEFAVANGARIANASFGAAHGGWDPERDAIEAAGNAGLLFVAAAGNNATNTDLNPFYPAAYPLDNIVAVGASNPSDGLAYFSNYGQSSTDLLAPGEGILSTVPDGYDYAQGTSMASPVVAGAAALVKSLHPNWTPQKLRRQLVGSATPIPGLEGKVASCGRLNVDAATDPATVIKPVLCVIRRGSGLGSVTSSPAAIDCGSTCSAVFPSGTQVTLTPSPAPGYAFGGWSGPCTGTGSCTTTLTAATTAVATFIDKAAQGGWTNKLLTPPSGHDPLPPGSSSAMYESFFNVSLSANGKVRAKTVYHRPTGWCFYETSNTGGVSVERKTTSGWVASAFITAPYVGPAASDRWMNCAGWGTVTRLSGDGSTLVIGSDTFGYPQWRCVAFVYRRVGGTWQPDGTLYPQGVNAQGTPDFANCGTFAMEGAISNAGDRIAIYAPQPHGDAYRPRVIVWARSASGWALEKTIVTPLVADCASWPDGTGEHRMAMSGDGARILVGDPYCNGGVGRVHHYTRSGSSWTKQANVSNPDPTTGRWFGRSVALSGNGLTAALGLTYQPGQANAVATSWVFELSSGTWTKRTRLQPGLADPGATFACTALVRAGARAVCASRESHGFNDAQGSLYVFNKPSGGWSAGSTRTRLFARLGYPSDWIGAAGLFWQSSPAVREDGNLIDATITPLSLALGSYSDRIGYEFRR